MLIQPFAEDVIGSDDLADVPQAEDFGAEVENPAAPLIVPDNLLDLNPEPIEAEE